MPNVLLLGDSHTVGDYGKELEANFKQAGYTVSRVGYGGKTAKDMLENRADRSSTATYVGNFFIEKIKSWDIVIISFGTNDAGGMQAYAGEPGVATSESVTNNILNLASTVKAKNKYYVGTPQFKDDIAEGFTDGSRYASDRYRAIKNGTKLDLNYRCNLLFKLVSSKFSGISINPRLVPNLVNLNIVTKSGKNDLHFTKAGGKLWADYVYSNVKKLDGSQEPTTNNTTAPQTAGSFQISAVPVQSNVFTPAQSSINLPTVPTINEFEYSMNLYSNDELGSYLDLSTATYRGIIAKYTEKKYSINSIEGIEFYKGQVLRVQEVTINNQNENGWCSSLVGGSYTDKLLKCKVRIPELHKFLPIPLSFDETEQDSKIIDQYPTFLYDPIVPIWDTISISDIVNVSFDKMTNFSNPKIINKIGIKKISLEGLYNSLKSLTNIPSSFNSIDVKINPSSSKDHLKWINDYYKNVKNKASLYKKGFLLASRAWGIEYDMLRGFVSVESGFNPDAVSKAGAAGLVQIMRSTWTEMTTYSVHSELHQKFEQTFGISISKSNIKNPDHNLFVCAYIVKKSLIEFDGDIEKVTAAYNGGPNWLKGRLKLQQKNGGDWKDYVNKSETRDYIWRVTLMWKKFQEASRLGE